MNGVASKYTGQRLREFSLAHQCLQFLREQGHQFHPGQVLWRADIGARSRGNLSCELDLHLGVHQVRRLENEGVARGAGQLASNGLRRGTTAAELATIQLHQPVRQSAGLLVDNARDVHLAGSRRTDNTHRHVQLRQEDRLVHGAFHIVDDIAFNIFLNRGNNRRRCRGSVLGP